MEEKRIYVIVAETVQNPLEMMFIAPKHYVLRPTSDTKTIVQPKGRIGAQIGHVVSQMRQHILLEAATPHIFRKGRRKARFSEWFIDVRELATQAITTIVLAARDSYELEFRSYLIRKAGVHLHSFYDINEAIYGRGRVMTAVCTEPVEPEKLCGITDYLELWG